MGFLAALAYALLMSAIPLADVIWHDRSPAALVLLFWFETVLGARHRRDPHRRAPARDANDRPLRADERGVRLEGGRRRGRAPARRRATPTSSTSSRSRRSSRSRTACSCCCSCSCSRSRDRSRWADAKLALAWAVARAGHVPADRPAEDRALELRRARPGRRAGVDPRAGHAGRPDLRPARRPGMFGPWGLVGMLMGLRAFADAGIVWLTGLMKMRDLPPGFKRFLARRAKQSEEEIEAEFDAMKEKGAPSRCCSSGRSTRCAARHAPAAAAGDDLTRGGATRARSRRRSRRAPPSRRRRPRCAAGAPDTPMAPMSTPRARTMRPPPTATTCGSSRMPLATRPACVAAASSVVSVRNETAVQALPDRGRHRVRAGERIAQQRERVARAIDDRDRRP